MSKKHVFKTGFTKVTGPADSKPFEISGSIPKLASERQGCS